VCHRDYIFILLNGGSTVLLDCKEYKQDGTDKQNMIRPCVKKGIFYEGKDSIHHQEGQRNQERLKFN
jgi:hypothetical protein